LPEISITKAKYLTEYKIFLEFSDGKNGNVDLEKYIFSTKLKFIQPLRDINIFQKFRLDYTLIWSDEIDLAPEFLYFKLFEDDKSLQEQFEKWGYI